MVVRYLQGGKSCNRNPSLRFASYDEAILRDALCIIDNFTGGQFTTRRVAHQCGLKPQSMARHMHHLLYAGAIKVVDIHYRTSNSKLYRFLRNFESNDIEDLLDKMQDNYKRGVDYSMCFCRDEGL